MATVAFGGSTWNTTAGNKTVTLTPAKGDLIVVICANSGRTTAQPPTVSDDQGGTYSRHATAATNNTSADSVWVFVRDQPVASSVSTVVTMTQSSDTGGGLVVWAVTGAERTGLSAIRQVGKQDNQAAATPSIAMGTAILPANAAVGFVLDLTNGSANSAPPTGWTEDSDAGYNVPATGHESVHRASGETLTTIAWTAATPTGFASILAEIDTSPLTRVRQQFPLRSFALNLATRHRVTQAYVPAYPIVWGDWSSTFSNVVSAEAYALEGVDFTTQPSDDLSVQSWAVQPLAAAAFNPASGFPWNQDHGESFVASQCYPDPTTDLANAFGPPLNVVRTTAWPGDPENWQQLPGDDPTIQAWAVQPPLNADRALAFNQPQDVSASPVDDDSEQAWNPAPPSAAAFDPAAGFPWAREGGEVQAERVQDDTPQGWPPGPAWGTYSSTFSNLVSAEAYAIEGGEVAAQPTVDPSVQPYAIQPPAAAAFNPGTGFPWNIADAELYVLDQNVPEPDLAVEFGATQFDPSAGTAWNQDEGERFVQSFIVGEDWQSWAIQPPAAPPVTKLTAFSQADNDGVVQFVPTVDDTDQAMEPEPPVNATQALAFNQPDEAPYATVEDPTAPTYAIQPPPYIPVFQTTAWPGDPENWPQLPGDDISAQAWAITPPQNAVSAQAFNVPDEPFTERSADDTAQAYAIQPPVATFDPSTVPWTGRDDIVQPVWQVADDTVNGWTPQPPASPAAFFNQHPDEPPFPWWAVAPEQLGWSSWQAVAGVIPTVTGGFPPGGYAAGPVPGNAAANPTPGGAASNATPAGEAANPVPGAE